MMIFRTLGIGLLRIGILGGILLDVISVEAQPPSNTTTSNGASINMRSGFVLPVLDENRKLKGRIKGKETKILTGTGETLIKEFHLETIQPGTRETVELSITASEANYSKQFARSSGEIEMVSGDGQFRMKGKGFSWDINSGLLTITNHLETVLIPNNELKKDDIKSQSGFVGDWKEIEKLHIKSQSLIYSISEARATYKGNVHAFDPNKLDVNSQLLYVKLRPEGDSIDQIVAEKNVRVKLDQAGKLFKVSSGKATYRRQSGGKEILVLSENNPNWSAKSGSGFGDVLSFYLPEKKVLVEANAGALLKIPAKSQKALEEQIGAQTIFGEFVEINCDSYIFQNNLLTISGVSHLQSGITHVDTHEVTLITNDDLNPRKLIAGPGITLKTKVKDTPFSLSGRQLTIDKLESESPLALVENDVRWAYGVHSGSGESVGIQLPDLNLECSGDAVINLMLSEWAQKKEEEEPAVISCSGYSYTGTALVLYDNVSLTHPRWNLSADQGITLGIKEDTTQIESIHANGNVHIEARYSIKNEKKPDPSVTRFLGGLIRQGSPWNMWCQELLIEIDNTNDSVKSFSALQDVKLERGGNTGTGGQVLMSPGSEKMIIKLNPEFTMASGTKLKGRAETMFSWDIHQNSFRVFGGPYNVVLPSKAIQTAQPQDK